VCQSKGGREVIPEIAEGGGAEKANREGSVYTLLASGMVLPRSNNTPNSFLPTYPSQEQR